MCQDTADVPASLVLRRRGRAPVTPALPRSFTLAGGLGSLPTALAALPGVTVRLATAVHRVAAARGGFRLETSDGELHVPAVALACDATSARPLLEGLRPGLGALLPQVAPVVSEAVVVPGPAVRLRPLAGLVGQTAAFFSVVTRDPVDDPALRAFTFHFRPGYSAAQRQDVMAGVLGVPPARWLLRVSKPAGLPAFRLGHEERVRQLDEALAESGLQVTGNYLTGTALEDCVARSMLVFQRWGAFMHTCR